MTNYTFATQAQLTEFLENAPLYLMQDGTLWNDSLNPPRSPFYYESSTNTVNFFYGVNLCAAASDSQLKTEINNMLATIGVTITAAQWSTIANGGSNGTSSAADLQAITQNLNSYAEEHVPSVVKGVADTITQYILNAVLCIKPDKISSPFLLK